MTNPLLTDPWQRRMAARVYRIARESQQAWRRKRDIAVATDYRFLAEAYGGLESGASQQLWGMRQMLHSLFS